MEDQRTAEGDLTTIATKTESATTTKAADVSSAKPSAPGETKLAEFESAEAAEQSAELASEESDSEAKENEAKEDEANEDEAKEVAPKRRRIGKGGSAGKPPAAGKRRSRAKKSPDAKQSPKGKRRLSGKRRLAGIRMAIAIAFAAVLFVGAAAFAGSAIQPYLSDRANVATRLKVARTAASAITTLWTYTPENMDTLADRAQTYLTGDFAAQYRKFVDQIVAPNKQAKISNSTEVTGVAVENLDGPNAVALVYTNTTSTSPMTKNIPSLRYLSFRLIMKRDNARWLVTRMNTITSLDVTPHL